MFGKKEVTRTFVWAPAEDITPYELAMCMSMLIATVQRYSSNSLVSGIFDTLPESAKRHFKVLDSARQAA